MASIRTRDAAADAHALAHRTLGLLAGILERGGSYAEARHVRGAREMIDDERVREAMGKLDGWAPGNRRRKKSKKGGR